MKNNPEIKTPADLKKRGAGRFSGYDYLAAILIFSALVLQGLITIHQIGISDDEPYYFLKAKDYFSWFSSLGKSGAFSRDTLMRTFGPNLKSDTHPTLFKLTGAVSYGLLKTRLGGFWAYRMNAVIMFGLLLAMIYLCASRAWGRAAGIASVLCTAFMPRVFINCHLATTEAALCLFWFSAAWMFEAGTRRKSLIPLAGVCYGLLMSAKFTGFLLPIPLIIWAFVYRRKNLALLCASLFIIGTAVFFLLQPYLWGNLARGFYGFILMSITRKEWIPILVQFLGKNYRASPPWYYAPFMVLITVPPATLGLFFLGTIKALGARLADQFSGFCLINFLFLIVMTMSPNAPLYDGVRLFLPAFVFLGLIAGNGFDMTVRWFVNLSRSKIPAAPLLRYPRLPGTALALLLALGVTVPLIRVYPYGLEYYNSLIGGAKGAAKLGMETAYWWSALNEKALARLNQELPANAWIRFFPPNPYLPSLYKELNLLRGDLRTTQGQDFDYLLILSRPRPNFFPYFYDLGVSQSRLKPLDSQELDGVPLWVLYKDLNDSDY